MSEYKVGDKVLWKGVRCVVTKVKPFGIEDAVMLIADEFVVYGYEIYPVEERR